MTKIKLAILVTIVIGVWSIHPFESKTDLAVAQRLSSLDVKQEHQQKENCLEGKGKVDPAKIEEMRLKKLTHLAQYFGIETEGKTIEQLKAEIEKAKQANPEKWNMLKKELHDKKIKMLEQKSRGSVK